MIAVIGDSENTGSIGVHASLGFHMVGTLRSVGVKFGHWVDVVSMQRPLAGVTQTSPETVAPPPLAGGGRWEGTTRQ